MDPLAVLFVSIAVSKINWIVNLNYVSSGKNNQVTVRNPMHIFLSVGCFH